MFPMLFHHPRRSPSPSVHDAVQTHETSVLDQVARGLSQFDARTDHGRYLCSAPQSMQNRIDAQIAQYSSLFEAHQWDETAEAELSGSAMTNGMFQPNSSEPHSSVSVPSLSRASSSAPSHSSTMAVTPVEELYPMQFINPELLRLVPPPYPSPHPSPLNNDSVNVVETVLSRTISTESHVLGAECEGGKRKRTDADEASVVKHVEMSHEKRNIHDRHARNERAGSKKPKHKLVCTNGRPASTIDVSQIRNVLGLRAVHPPGMEFECPVPGCTASMVEPDLLEHFKVHSKKEGPNACPVASCKNTLSDGTALGRHLRDVHLSAQALKCSVCRGTINRNASDQIRRHVSSGKHEHIWPQLGLVLVLDDGVSAPKTSMIKKRRMGDGNEEDDKEEGSSDGMKRRRCS